ncbi:MAG TPA: hypothetical protein PLG38_06355 [Propionibacteriaceae bacterium]|nr:hypothetical protein [Propionibacteriaceae bacterium]
MSAVLTMILVFLISGAVFVVSAVGIGGRGSRTAPAGAVRYLETAADHLNGDAEPPAAVSRLFPAA